MQEEQGVQVVMHVQGSYEKMNEQHLLILFDS